jgi:uncharacterized protein YPO0396
VGTLPTMGRRRRLRAQLVAAEGRIAELARSLQAERQAHQVLESRYAHAWRVSVGLARKLRMARAEARARPVATDVPSWAEQAERPLCLHVAGRCAKPAGHDGEHFYRNW